MSSSANSAAFTEFLEQLHATGYAVGSGFDPRWFDNMTDVEKRQAEALLVDTLQKGNATVVHALGQLATASAIQALRQCLQHTLVPSYANAEIAAALWKATHDLAYQDLLIQNLTISNDLIRVAITVDIISTAHTAKLLDTCIRLAEADPYDTVRSEAARGALHIVGLVPDLSDFNHPYRPLTIRIASEDVAVRTQAVAEFKTLVDTARVKIALP